MKIQYTLSFLLITMLSLGQVTMESNGEIPANILESSTGKYYAKKQEILDSSFAEPREIRLSRLKVLEQGIFLIDAIKTNGRVYINDSYSKLVNKIADDLLKNQPELRKSINLYAYKSPYVNAFSTDQGDIFFTVGLLSHLENEAELAFVVGHEISHLVKQHAKVGLSERIKVASGRDEYSGLSIDEGWEAIHAFSRSLEKEADLMSIELYKETTYDKSAIANSLNKLKISNLGYEDDAFDYGLLLHSTLELPEGFYPTTFDLEKAKKRKSKNTSHPEVDTRISYCSELIDQIEDTSANDLFKHISEDDFIKLRNLARREQILLLFDQHLYANAMYNASIQMKQDPQNKKWFADLITLCYRKITQFKREDIKSFEDIYAYEGALFELAFVLYKNKKLDYNLLYFVKSYRDFLELPNAENRQELTSTILTLQKIKSSKWRKLQKNHYDTAKVDYGPLKTLLPLYSKIIVSAEYKNEFGKIGALQNEDSPQDTPSPPISISELKNIIVCNPFYLRIDERAEGYLDYTTSYNHELHLINAIEEVLGKEQIDFTMLDVRDINKDEGEKFDDISVLNDYLNRFFVHKLSDEVEIKTPSQYKLDSIRKKYNTDYVMLMGARSYKGTARGKIRRALLTSWLIPPYLPYGILNSLIKNHELQLFYMIVDLKTNTIIKIDAVEVLEMQDNKNLITLYVNQLISK